MYELNIKKFQANDELKKKEIQTSERQVEEIETRRQKGNMQSTIGQILSLHSISLCLLESEVDLGISLFNFSSLFASFLLFSSSYHIS